MSHYWRTVEHWRRDGLGLIRELWLMNIDEPFTKGWRVEWNGPRRRDGQSFTDLSHDPAFELQAQEFLAAKMLEAGEGWYQVD